eukprot:6466217-Amphidinium_carterae.2
MESAYALKLANLICWKLKYIVLSSAARTTEIVFRENVLSDTSAAIGSGGTIYLYQDRHGNTCVWNYVAIASSATRSITIHTVIASVLTADVVLVADLSKVFSNLPIRTVRDGHTGSSRPAPLLSTMIRHRVYEDLGRKQRKGKVRLVTKRCSQRDAC